MWTILEHFTLRVKHAPLFRESTDYVLYKKYAETESFDLANNHLSSNYVTHHYCHYRLNFPALTIDN